jgi:hypothetical protein
MTAPLFQAFDSICCQSMLLLSLSEFVYRVYVPCGSFAETIVSLLHFEVRFHCQRLEGW